MCEKSSHCCGHVQPPALQSCIPIPIEEKRLVEVISKAKDWALMHGVCMRSKANYDVDSLQFAPFVLTPSAFPRKEFEKAIRLQPILNELMHKVAHTPEFLKKTLSATIEVDEFSRNLFKIYEHVLQDKDNQATISLGLFRSDYMAHYLHSGTIKQVEINTIASSFGGIATYLTPMHSYILRELGEDDKLVDLPENNALTGLCSAMIEAWNIIGNTKAAILFVIEAISYNICDQRFHEFEIRRLNPSVKVIRKTLTELIHDAKLGNNRELYVDDVEISVIYFRAGYEPGHYLSQKEWDARLLLEKSKAIKCPSIQYHLAGTKKVQQALARPGVLKSFLTDEKKIESVKEIFTGLYSLDFNEEGDAAIKMALMDPEKYVLKPQREGGGNNIYGKDIPKALEKMKDSLERSAWIIMERIFPPISKGYVVRPGESVPPKVVDLVSELGIFGVIIGDKDKILLNHQVGHMLRTKLSTVNEGGVAAGLGALDSPYLID